MSKDKSNLIEKVRELNIPPVDSNRDLIKEYYEERAAKYGFKEIPEREQNS